MSIEFWAGVIVGANVGLLLFALLSMAAEHSEKRKVYRLRSECCDFPVEVEPAFRCLKCGHYCRVKEGDKWT